jgi:ankyrin repeat protein
MTRRGVCLHALALIVIVPAVAPAREPTPAGRAKVDIFRAIELGDLARVKTLLEEGVKIDAVDDFGYSPLHTASFEHQDAILRYLIDKGADLNLPDRKNGSRLLHYAANLNQLAAAEAALAKGARLDVEDGYGNQPLWNAVFNDKGRNARIEMVKLFMAHGADPDHKNRSGRSPRDLVKIAKYDNLRAALCMN